MLSGWTRLPWIRMSARAEAAGKLAHPAARMAANITLRRMVLSLFPFSAFIERDARLGTKSRSMRGQGFTYRARPGKNRTNTTIGIGDETGFRFHRADDR